CARDVYGSGFDYW
nr:immunoglobulin heavy chain junction region [Macaca mulatta]MOV38991.1 immunoglobulin heavy chain junction region [Macaca mulatta]MOV41879.1 immunoglobulin heavy chain junction region [Macaca mulatta]MOV45076.1 immunoglobulin heavy chain junction region [Macaca mulatta]MOV48833.1 immunoglobulin heavy chain junction region [Macaca mulatta]